MVSTTRTKTRKSLPVYVKQCSFIQSFLLVETIIGTWMTISFKKTSLLPSRSSFSGYSFFHLTDIPACEKSFSVKWKRFFNEFFILASGNRKSILVFRDLLKLLKFGGGNSCLRKLFSGQQNLFFPISQILLLVKAMFRLVETYF